MNPLHIIWFLWIWIFPLSETVSKEKHPFNHESEKQESDSNLLRILVFPEYGELDTPIHYSGFSLLYDEKHEQARWVAYVLDMSRTYRVAERSSRFFVDPAIRTGSANHADYKNSGFDRGHLAPAAAMSWSETAMKESFYFSNMSPQSPDFNRGIWNKLEQQVRKWTQSHQQLYVVTGPILHDRLPSIGANEVSVPEYYFKTLLVYNDSITQGIGFIVPNRKGEFPLQSYAVSIDSVEQMSGINFYHHLADSLEEELESNLCIPCWFQEK